VFSQESLDWLDANGYDKEAIDRVGQYGNSALMKAVREAHYAIAKELIEAGASLEIKNIDGNSALWNACFGQSAACVELLLKGGIDLDSTNDNGVTALMYCASAGREDMVRLLIEHGANKSIENLDGFKAIDLATTPTIYRLLKQ